MVEIDEQLVAALVAEQFPHWADLPVAAVADQGWDNRTFRLGTELSVRLPSTQSYVAAVAKEDAVLPALAPGRGRCADGCPAMSLRSRPDLDHEALARDLASFSASLRGLPTEDGFAAGRHSFFRGCHPSVYGDEVDVALRALGGQVDVGQCREVWRAATTSAWSAAPVWVHGDLDVGNLLTGSGRLCAVLDFGCCAVGDPACDLAMAWTYFSGAERRIFREATGLGAATWERARGWALWKALATMAGLSSPGPEQAQERHLAEILTDPLT